MSQKSLRSCVVTAERSLQCVSNAGPNKERQAKAKNILLNLLSLDNTLALLAVDGARAHAQAAQRVYASNEAAQQAREPGAGSILREGLGVRQLPDTAGVEVLEHVDRQVSGVTKLATNGQVLEHRVGLAGARRRCGGNGGGLDVLDVFAHTQQLTRGAELLLDGGPRLDRGLGRIRPDEIPGIEAREVLDRPQNLVTADCETNTG